LLLRIQDQKPNISFENMSGFLGSKRFEQTERGEVSSRNGKIEKSLFGRNQFVSKRVKELIVKQYKICGWLALRVCWRIKLFNNTDQVLVHYHHYASFIFNNYFNDKIFLGFSFSPNLNHHPFCINRSKRNTRLMPKLLSSNSVTTSFISTVPTVKCCPWKSELCLVVEEDVISITPVFHQDMNKILWKSSGKSSNFALWKSIARKTIPDILPTIGDTIHIFIYWMIIVITYINDIKARFAHSIIIPSRTPIGLPGDYDGSWGQSFGWKSHGSSSTSVCGLALSSYPASNLLTGSENSIFIQMQQPGFSHCMLASQGQRCHCIHAEHGLLITNCEQNPGLLESIKQWW